MNSQKSTSIRVSLNTNFRTIAKNDFEKDTSRPLSNSVFSESIQSKRNGKKKRVITNKKHEK